jgi:hypothetical protein
MRAQAVPLHRCRGIKAKAVNVIVAGPNAQVAMRATIRFDQRSLHDFIRRRLLRYQRRRKKNTCTPPHSLAPFTQGSNQGKPRKR